MYELERVNRRTLKLRWRRGSGQLGRRVVAVVGRGRDRIIWTHPGARR